MVGREGFEGFGRGGGGKEEKDSGRGGKDSLLVCGFCGTWFPSHIFPLRVVVDTSSVS